MKLAISNIAWGRDDDETAARLMTELGVEGVEIAPTAVWPEPLAARPEDVAAHRDFWLDRGIRVVALQALLYGRPELTIFDGEPERQRTLEYLRGIMALGAALGACALVFGSPGNRRVGARPMPEVERIATRFFRDAAHAAEDHGVVLCIEPNPTDYGCDFVTTAEQALTLVDAVDSPGFAVHLDTAAAALGGDDIAGAVAACAPRLAHFHASEPFLAPLGQGGADHAGAADALRQQGYAHWVSVEMRQHAGTPVSTTLRSALTLLSTTYDDRVA